MEWFKYNGKRSDTYGIRIHNSLEFTAPSHDISAVQVPGRHGDLLIDNERMNAFDKTLILDINLSKAGITSNGNGSKLHSRVREITEWLMVKGWHDWEWSMYPGYVWRATVLDPYNIADAYRWKGRAVIRVRFQPVMYISPITEHTITSGTNVLGMGKLIAKPLIKLVMAKPNVTVSLNGEPWFMLTGAVGNVEIDSELMQVRDNNGNASGKLARMRPLYPELTLTNNIITYDATAISVFRIVPRWAERAT